MNPVNLPKRRVKDVYTEVEHSWIVMHLRPAWTALQDPVSLSISPPPQKGIKEL